MSRRHHTPDRDDRDEQPLYCAACGNPFTWAWIGTPDGQFCHDCFYRLYPWADPCVPTDKRYDRRLL